MTVVVLQGRWKKRIVNVVGWEMDCRRKWIDFPWWSQASFRGMQAKGEGMTCGDEEVSRWRVDDLGRSDWSAGKNNYPHVTNQASTKCSTEQAYS